MKELKLKNYVSPLIDIVEVKIEKGFAASDLHAGGEGMDGFENLPQNN